MAEGLKSGDQVRLMSGGPYMTVDKVAGNQVTCVWFHEQELRLASFGLSLLINRKDVEAEQSAASERMTARLRRVNNLHKDFY